MTHRIFRRYAWLATLALASTGSPAARADAAHPHLEAVDATMANPVVTPGKFSWDGSLDVPFQVAGLGKNSGLTVTLNAKLTALGFVAGLNGPLNTLFFTFGFTFPSGVSFGIEGLGNASIGGSFFQTGATLTSNQNGQVTSTLSIPGDVEATIPDNLLCVKISWTLIALTFGNQTVSLPDVIQLFDSTGSSCSNLPQV